MADVFSKAKRSHVMSLIRSRGNKETEIVLAKIFRAHKITGWRRHSQLKIKIFELKTFTVRPDFVFTKSRTAVFVDGCFWHGCPIHGTKPKGNAAFWKKKFATNITRDRLVNRTMRSAKWRVLRIWEHELVRKRQPRLIRRLQTILK